MTYTNMDILKDEIYDFLMTKNPTDVFDLANELNVIDSDDYDYDYDAEEAEEKYIETWDDFKNDLDHSELAFEVTKLLNYEEYPTLELFVKFWNETYE